MELKEERKERSLISKNMRGQQDRCIHRASGRNERLIS